MKYCGRVSIVLASLDLFGCSSLRWSSNLAAAPPRVPVPPVAEAQVEGRQESPTPPSPSDAQRSVQRAPAAPTWTTIYARYLSPDSEGGCGKSRECHADAMSDSASAYAWLTERGYIAGTQSRLVSTTNSCLLWFGGNMPPCGAPNDGAVRDLEAWVAAGALPN